MGPIIFDLERRPLPVAAEGVQHLTVELDGQHGALGVGVGAPDQCIVADESDAAAAVADNPAPLTPARDGRDGAQRVVRDGRERRDTSTVAPRAGPPYCVSGITRR